MTAPVSPPEYSGDIVARASAEYRWKRYIMVALLVGGGLWFAYDGYHAWPKHNERVADVQARLDEAQRTKDEATASQLRVELSKMHKPYNSKELMFQKALAWTLPPAGLALLAWTIYNSRGRYRLAGDTLEVPGHPPVTLNQIVRLDTRTWDRKGIANADYELRNGTKGRLRLDDFVYERAPTDRIYEAIEQNVKAAAAAAARQGEPSE
jgi:hypothetical protein